MKTPFYPLKRWLCVHAMLVALLMVCTLGSSLAQNSWPYAGFDHNNTRYNPKAKTISPDNVANLVVNWALETGSDISATPAVDKDYLYFPDWGGNLNKVSRKTGEIIWQVQLGSLLGSGFSFARATPAIAGNKLIIGTQLDQYPGAHVLAVDKNSGALLWVTQVDTHFAAIITNSAVAMGNDIYVGVSSLEEVFAGLIPDYPCCSFRGSVLKLDLLSGEILWKTYMAPDGKGFSGNAVWGSTAVIDPKRNSVYVATGNNYSVPAAIEACVFDENGLLRPEAEIIACVAAVDGSTENFFDAVVALDMTTGAIKWAKSVLPVDAWTVACLIPYNQLNPDNCPDTESPDYDFGQGPILFRTAGGQELLGAGQKSGIYWAFNPDNGSVVWQTHVGPGGEAGGLQWGSATDGSRIYTAVSNSRFTEEILSDGTVIRGGKWAALDASTGQLLWETAGTKPPVVPPDPALIANNMGPVSSANGLVFGGAMDAQGTMYAMDAASGEILWSFESGASVISGAAIVDGNIYWGNGYTNFGGTGSGGAGSFLPDPNGGPSRMYAFGLAKKNASTSARLAGADEDIIGLQLTSWPNPFRTHANISFSLAEAAQVKISIYNELGKEIVRLADKRLEAGKQTFSWKPAREAAGMYILRVQINDKSYGRRIMYIE